MREIKFRAWDNYHGGWEYSKPMPDMGFWKWVAYDSNTKFYQYTGLRDKNGVEIYEGDVVKILYTDWPSQLDSNPEMSHEEYLDSLTVAKVVIWSVQGFYLSESVDGYASSMEPGTHGYLEVVGNIYENPELLSR